MRVLFCAVPAYGHLLPLAPLIEAALADGHQAAVLTSGDMRLAVEDELAAGVQLLAAGPTAIEFTAEAARRTGTDVMRPAPEVVGEVFGACRLELGGAESVERARDWAPDLVIAEYYDTTGPLVAAALGIPWHQAGIGPAVPPELAELIGTSAARYHREAGIVPEPPTTYLDPWPEELQEPGWSSAVPPLPMRGRAHRRPEGREAPQRGFATADRLTALVTLGTVFSDPQVLDEFVAAVSSRPLNLRVTLGMAHGAGPNAARADEVRDSGAEIHYVPFAPLDDLLDGAGVVVGAGGSGTVLGALSRGIPLVLCPQGADQPTNAARAAAAGVAVVVDSPAGIAAAIEQVMSDPSYAQRAAAVAAELSTRPAPVDVLRALTGSPEPVV
ncbi:nucleotide disphospho-sugar-binding domain-containing protein [Saccharopolyspora sp. 6M]|uniref:nucleotide disphospho-sugar-binding domain-containing protein n=1 Tax=Saccharopolyspora sp. 6M TaxID=2877237 RepID=UPI001CD5F814|nr:nucleotide disphospho-sugar-binding domain-containing protein [Saccharopolyspora sp. 6M]MCA1228953.1 glycosyltransferase [Saccharopolyspora sp. 6M]